MSLPDREQELLTTLDAINDASLPYVLVGGWAVTAFNQRFSTDVDLVVPEEGVEDYESFLLDRDYDERASTIRVGSTRAGSSSIRRTSAIQ